MNCPICNAEMEQGGIVTGGVTAMWHPLREFEKKKWSRVVYVDGRPIGKSSILLNQTRIPNAWFCRNCNKIVGIFDIEDMNQAIANTKCH